MVNSPEAGSRPLEQRFLTTVIIVLALTVFIITWFGIKESRSDSYRLLVLQGTAFIEALTRVAENAIAAEELADYLLHKRYSEIVVEISQTPLSSINQQRLYDLALNHSLYSVFVYGVDSNLIAGATARGSVFRLPDFVHDEVTQLIAEPENNYVILLDEEDRGDEERHFYIEINNKMDRVVVLVADAHLYVEALRQTQIGYLAQTMAQEPGVEYIIYQSTDGIIFSSRRTANLLAIESDPFLKEALDSDTVMHREYSFQDKSLLELVSPFATADYPYGIMRVGLSLEGYRAIARGYNIQTIALSVILFVLVVTGLLYLNSRAKRREITRQYRQIKSISDRILAEMHSGVAVVDPQRCFILANDAFLKQFQLKNAEGRTWDECLGSTKLSYKKINQIAEETFEEEITFAANTEQKRLLIAVSKAPDEDEQEERLVVVVYDVTRLRELESKSARKERLSEMGNLAAGVAHEIRNPLNAIAIASQRLAAEFQPAENAEEYLSFTRQIKDETKRLNEIITRFLALAREDKNRKKQINLREFVESFCSLIRYEAEQAGIEIGVRVPNGLLIEGDTDSLKQVFSNLYNNAKEAFEQKGGKIEVSAHMEGSSVVIRFADSGPGIPTAIRDKVFTPYYTTKEAGTGLGLPTVYRVVVDMGGEVLIEDTPIQGTTILIVLPSAK